MRPLGLGRSMRWPPDTAPRALFLKQGLGFGYSFDDLRTALDTPARVGHSGVPINAADAETRKAEAWWTGFTIGSCNKTFFHLYCLEI